MLGFIFNSPAWQLITQADWMTKLVLLILFSFSVICIAIIIFKYLNFLQERKKINELLYKINKTNNFNELLELGKKFQNTLGGKLIVQNLNELKKIIDKKENKNILSSQNIEYLEFCSEQTIDQLLMESEVYLPVLGTSSAVSPLIGLFGTVWGLIHAFVNISQEKSADISVVAPGIAEALTTTLAGLVVAIPAMIAFHYFSNEIRKFEHKLFFLSDKFTNIVKQTFSK